MGHGSLAGGVRHVLPHHVVDDQGAPVDDGVLDSGVTQVDEGQVPGAPVAHRTPGAHLNSRHRLLGLINTTWLCACSSFGKVIASGTAVEYIWWRCNTLSILGKQLPRFNKVCFVKHHGNTHYKQNDRDGAASPGCLVSCTQLKADFACKDSERQVCLLQLQQNQAGVHQQHSCQSLTTIARSHNS